MAGDLFVVSGNVNGNVNNNNNNNNKNQRTIANSTTNDMSSTSMASPTNINTETGAVVQEKCADQCEKIIAKINCRPNDDNNSLRIGPVITSNGGRTCAQATTTTISKSWYARCNNRWRSQSCDRRYKNMTMRYSWNTAAMNRLA